MSTLIPTKQIMIKSQRTVLYCVKIINDFPFTESDLVGVNNDCLLDDPKLVLQEVENTVVKERNIEMLL